MTKENRIQSESPNSSKSPRIVLVTGGSRSGKSAYAEKLGESISDDRVYIATCPPIDEEIQKRIARHKRERAGKGWKTIEEERDVSGVIHSLKNAKVVVVDCLTLWINNILFGLDDGQLPSEDDIVRDCETLISACDAFAGSVIFVTNEVGMGLVPADPVSRRYRDLVGRCNQTIARGADQVVFMVSGIPFHLKTAGVAP